MYDPDFTWMFVSHAPAILLSITLIILAVTSWRTPVHILAPSVLIAAFAAIGLVSYGVAQDFYVETSSLIKIDWSTVKGTVTPGLVQQLQDPTGSMKILLTQADLMANMSMSLMVAAVFGCVLGLGSVVAVAVSNRRRLGSRI